MPQDRNDSVSDFKFQCTTWKAVHQRYIRCISSSLIWIYNHLKVFVVFNLLLIVHNWQLTCRVDDCVSDIVEYLNTISNYVNFVEIGNWVKSIKHLSKALIIQFHVIAKLIDFISLLDWVMFNFKILSDEYKNK